MAENLTSRSAEPRYPNGDPFAELSRIMGKAPQPAVDQVEDDFDLDLERELMGEAPVEMRDDQRHESYERHSYAERPVTDESFAGRDEDLLADEFADAISAEFKAGPSAWAAAPAEQSWEREPVFAEEPAQLAPEQALADVDMDFGDLDLTDDMPAIEEPVDEPQPLYAAAPRERSLEEELGELLASDDEYTAPANLPVAAAASYADREPAYAPVPVDSVAAAEEPFDEDAWTRELNSEPEATEEYFAEPAVGQEPEPVAHEAPRAADPFSVLASLAPIAPAFAATSRIRAPEPQLTQPFDDADDFGTVEVAEAAVPAQDDLDIPDVQYAESEEPAVPDFDPDLELEEALAPVAASAVHPAPAQGGSTFDDDFAYDLTREAHDYQYPTDQDFDQPIAAGEVAADEYQPQPYADAEPQAPAQRRGNGMLIAALVAGVAVIGGVGAFALSFGSGGNTAGTPTLVRADSEPLKVKPENPGGTAVPNQESQAYQRVAGNEGAKAPTQEKLVTTTEEPIDLVARAEEGNGLPGVDEDLPELDSAPAPAAKSEERVEIAPETPGVGVDQDLLAVQPRRVRTMIVKPDGTLVAREEVPVPAEPALGPARNAASPAIQVAAPAAQAVREVATAAAQTERPGGMPAPRAVETVRITPQTSAAAEPQAAPTASSPAVPQAAAPQASTPAPKPAEAPRAAEAPKPAPQPAAQPQAQRETQVAQAAAPARTQPAAPAPAAAAGDWSMQIASQPTAEGAQSTYQDLARRYGSVLGGKGVNIVRADIPGKGTYYRVRIPSNTRNDAIALCERYKAAGGSCFVSK